MNGDGIVNAQDLAIVSSNWLATGQGIPGDVNGDGIVNAQDLAIVASSWTSATSNTPSGGSSQAGGSSNVPEPATAALAALAGAIFWIAYRRLCQ